MDREPTSPDASLIPLLTAAQALLATSLGTPVQLSDPHCLTEEGRRNRIVRCHVRDAAPGVPTSVIIKQVVADHYDPDDATSWDTQRFFRDWAGAQFLTEVAPDAGHSPRFYGGDRALGCIVLEDLGAHDSLVEPLLSDDAADATQVLLAFATRLGALHAATAGAAAHYDQILQRLAPTATMTTVAICRGQATEFGTLAEQLCAFLVARGVPIPPTLDHELTLIAETVAAPGVFLTYIHGDPCPDNLVVRDGAVRLIDFEFGQFGHALQDGIYGHMLFPTCWCANQLPPTVRAQMDDAYRAALGQGSPELADATRGAIEGARMGGYWLMRTLARQLEPAHAADRTWGIATVRQRLIARLAAFQTLATTASQLPGLCAWAAGVQDYLQRQWPGTPDLPLYPAFRADT